MYVALDKSLLSAPNENVRRRRRRGRRRRMTRTMTTAVMMVTMATKRAITKTRQRETGEIIGETAGKWQQYLRCNFLSVQKGGAQLQRR